MEFHVIFYGVKYNDYAINVKRILENSVLLLQLK